MATTTHKPVAATVTAWLRANLGKGCLAACTAQDFAALLASVQIINLIAYTDHDSEQLATAWGAVVRQMQPTCRFLAFHSVAHVLDWPDRVRIWKLAGFDSMPSPLPRCEFE